MSAEHNTSHSPVRRNESAASNANTSSNVNDTLDEATGSADNSIIGKVKSRVSSIIPSSLSKWFSPSTRNDSVNGNLSGSPRRRRRIEVEEYDEDDDADNDEQTHGEYADHSLGNQAEQGTDEESNNSEEDSAVMATKTVRSVLRNVKSTNFAQQPPIKRTRISLDVTNMHNSPLMQHQPLIASTPAVSSSLRSGGSDLYFQQSTGRGSINHYTHLNLYGNKSTKEAPYLFVLPGGTEEQHRTKGGTDIIDLVPVPALDKSTLESEANDNRGISSRRTLNLPSTSHAAAERFGSGFPNLKRQVLASVKNELANSSFSGGSTVRDNYGATIPSRTSTTILEMDTGGTDEHKTEHRIAPDGDELLAEEASKYNGRQANYLGKRQKLINGSGEELSDRSVISTAVVGNTDADSTSGSSEDGGGSRTGGEIPDSATAQRKTGLFNTSATHSRNGSRTSSFGNGINFYSHLEGRKSLFAGAQNVSGGGGNTLNNSTLSLTSLNRRQFNASIYGSTSALSDSRLLSTFSPFYKGKTTYGGAAAYNKYNLQGAGVGASAVRITPTLIRPTSSLSTLSSSNNSLAAAGTNAGVGGDSSSAISSTAKRILDLINDFATPLSEAKKMATNLKTKQQQQELLPQVRGKARLSDADVQAARAMRLQQVRTPYMRPAVTLQPTKGGLLPPVRELQVPSMSQLLQMKKMQSTTERSREIATQNNSETTHVDANAKYSLSVAVETNADGQQSQLLQQKHTNKIKNKLSTSARITASKSSIHLADDGSPPPVNLPNIAFPRMQSVPKFDIALPTVAMPGSTAATPKNELKFSLPQTTSKQSPTAVTDKQQGTVISSFNANRRSSLIDGTIADAITTTKSTTGSTTQSFSSVKTTTITTPTYFKFSAPLEVKESSTATQHITPLSRNYTFSKPAAVPLITPVGVLQPMKTPPPLKTGSVLDALKKSPILPTTTTVATTGITSGNATGSSFGDQFKKSSGQWECDICLVRNAKDATKCIACESLRTSASVKSSPASAVNSITTSASAPAVSSFGNLFKKSANEWECDTCMVRNKQETNKCVACETPRKDVGATPSYPPSFGNAFKSKANTWECPTCLINNKNEDSECVACQTKKPGAEDSSSKGAASLSTASTTFKFGFTPSSVNTSGSEAAASATTADEGFKLLAAAQKTSKWECEACMTRNDATRLKCVCCEQAKPGTETVNENVPKFTFGTTAASKFTFGFGTANTTVSTNSTATATTTSTTQQKTDASPTKGGFVFGSTTAPAVSSSGFTFGFKPTTTTISTASTGEENKSAVTTTINSGIKLGATSTTGTTLGFGISESKATETVSSTTSTKTTSVLPSVKFSLVSSGKSDATDGAASTEAPATNTFTFGNSAVTAAGTNSSSSKPVGGFSFETSVNSTNKPENQTGTSTATIGFAFKTPMTATTLSNAGTSSNTKTFAFGAPTTSPSSACTTNATSTVAVKPTFSFAGPASTAAVPTTIVVTSTTASICANSSINVNSGAPVTSVASAAGGFSFGSGISASPTSAKSLFGTGGPSAGATSTKSVPQTAFSSGQSDNINVFGTFGASTNTGFGSAAAAKAPVTTTTTSTTFGAFGATTTAANTTNMFGQSIGDSKPIASATPIFGNTNNTATATTSSNATATPFVFGSASSLANNSSGSNNTGTTTNTWPKNSFIFGSSTTASASPNSGTSATSEAPKSVFGSFGATQTESTAAASSLFGSATAQPGATTFENADSAGNIFGSANTTPAAVGSASNAPNLFGSSTSAPAFGSTTFGGTNSGAGATPVFGSSVPAQGTFGGFGATATTAASDGASAAKKSEPAFNFGASSTQSASGGFNFGSSAGGVKPAFNFTPANTAAFNFTGAAETDTNAGSTVYATGQTENSSTDTTSNTTVEKSTISDADKGVDQQQTGQQWLKHKNNQDDNNGTINAQDDSSSSSSRVRDDKESSSRSCRCGSNSRRQAEQMTTRTMTTCAIVVSDSNNSSSTTTTTISSNKQHGIFRAMPARGKKPTSKNPSKYKLIRSPTNSHNIEPELQLRANTVDGSEVNGASMSEMKNNICQQRHTSNKTSPMKALLKSSAIGCKGSQLKPSHFYRKINNQTTKSSSTMTTSSINSMAGAGVVDHSQVPAILSRYRLVRPKAEHQNPKHAVDHESVAADTDARSTTTTIISTETFAENFVDNVWQRDKATSTSDTLN